MTNFSSVKQSKPYSVLPTSGGSSEDQQIKKVKGAVKSVNSAWNHGVYFRF